MSGLADIPDGQRQIDSGGSTAPAAIAPILQPFLDSIVPRQAPGVSVYISNDDQHLTLHAGRYAVGQDRALDDRARFPMGGLVKPLMSLLCLQAESEGRLALDAPAGSILPELDADPSPGVTIRRLLSNTGGYCDPTFREVKNYEWQDWADHFNYRRQAFPPGLVWSGGQSGHIIIRRILESIYDMDMDDLIWSRILIPLGLHPVEARDNYVQLHGSSHRLRPDLLPPSEAAPSLKGVISPARLTIGDLGRLGEFFAGRCEHPMSNLVATMHQASVPTNVGSMAPGWEILPESFGLGLGRCLGAIGCGSADTGSTCGFRFHPNGAVVAVAMNACNDGGRDQVMFRTMTALGLKLFRTESRSTPPVSPGALAGFYIGQAMGYEAAWIEGDGRCGIDFSRGSRQFQITESPHGGLYLKAEAGPSVPLAVFTDPATQGPALMIGSSAFKKNIPS